MTEPASSTEPAMEKKTEPAMEKKAEPAMEKKVEATTPAPTPAPAPAPAAKAQTYKVDIKNFAFTPSTLSVKVGDTVTWHQSDDAPHSVVISNGTTSAVLSSGQEFSFTFTTAGQFTYKCGIHPSMTGTIEVK